MIKEPQFIKRISNEFLMSGIKEINKKNKSRQKFDIFVALVFDFLIQISLLIPP